MILSWLMSDYVVHSLNLKGLVAIRRSRSHIAVKPIRDRLKKILSCELLLNTAWRNQYFLFTLVQCQINARKKIFLKLKIYIPGENWFGGAGRH